MAESDILPTPALANDIQVDDLKPVLTEAQKEEQDKTERILALARKRFRTSESGYAFYREWARRAILFAAGKWGDISYQWPEGIQRERLADGRPCMTINRMRGFLRMVSNGARQANLRIQVNPVDDDGDPKLAEVLQGEIRNIERTSFADRAYAKAADKQAEIGLGFLRLIIEWADDTTFRQRIKIKSVPNPLRVFGDPSAQEPDWSDAEFMFYVTDVDADIYEAITGRPAPTSITCSFSSDADQVGDWFPGGKLRIANYYAVDRTQYQLIELVSGECLKEDDFRKMVEAAFAQLAAKNPFADVSEQAITQTMAAWRKDKAVVRRERTVRKKTWIHRIITADTIMEETIWPASSHPFIPVIGEELFNPETGERDFRGVTIDAMDAAKAYNVEVTGLVEDIGLGHKSPVVGYKGQFGAEGSNQRKAWELANKKPISFLEVDPMPQDDGRFAPFPIRNSYSPDIGSTVMGIRQADQDYKSTAGFHEASLGESGPQESRVAIVARQRQDEHATSNYADNIKFALAVCGKQLIELIRVVRDEPGVIRILGDGDRAKRVMVFAGKDKDPRNFARPDGQPFALPKGVHEIYDLTVGEFDVEVKGVPDPGDRREERAKNIVEMMKVVPPPMAAVMAPMAMKSIDVSDSQEISERMEEALPPELQRKNDEDQPPIPPQVKAQMQAMQQEGKALVERVKELEETVRTKKLELMARHMSDRLKAWLELTKLAVTEENADRRLMLTKQLEVASRFMDADIERLNMAQQQPAEAPMPPDAPMPPVAAPPAGPEMMA